MGRKPRGRKAEAMMDLRLPGFGRFRPGNASAAVFAGPSQARAYWEGLRSGCGIPDRAQLDPRGLGGVLDRVFVAEAIGRGLVQVRIAGSLLVETAGMDLRGLPLSCLFSADARPQLAKVLETVISGQALVEIDLANGRGGPVPVARLLLLPLTDGSERRLVLGCLGVTEGGLGACMKFDILRCQEEHLNPVAAEVVVPPPRPERRVPHLTLVHNRD
ncbi:MAG: hypothetical protein C0524_10655 [Rhodobacter sp.]|nr:hypothetical protein [Rhodobacter sp.]